jgi:hypothetical protein
MWLYVSATAFWIAWVLAGALEELQGIDLGPDPPTARSSWSVSATSMSGRGSLLPQWAWALKDWPMCASNFVVLVPLSKSFLAEAVHVNLFP